MTAYFNFREQWLTAAMQELVPTFERHGYKFPDSVKLSCGWPVGSRGGGKVLGQCFAPEASANGSTEIFISPTVASPVQAIGILAHELVHAAVGNKAGHGPLFKQACNRIGLTKGKATAAMPGPELEREITDVLMPMLGDYPHSTLDYSTRKKQGTRMIKLICPVTGYTVRTTAKWLKEGLPTSPAGHVMVIDGADEESGDE